MDSEAIIAAELAKNVPKETPSSGQVVVDDKPEGENAFHFNMEIEPAQSQALADYFNLDNISRRTESNVIQLREIYRWAASMAQSTDVATVMETLMKVENEIGSLHKSNRLQHLARFVSLHNQSRIIRAQMGEFYGYGI